MARIKLTLTEEHIALLKNIRFGELIIQHPEKDLDVYVDMIRKNLVKINEELADLHDPEWREKLKTERDYMPDGIINFDYVNEKLDRIMEASEISKRYAEADEKGYFGVDTYDLFGGNTLELIARFIGCYDKVIKGTEEDFDGPKFPKEVVEHMAELFDFIIDNFTDIEELIHQRCFKGGVEPNVTYIAYDNEHIWMTEEEFKKRRSLR